MHNFLKKLLNKKKFDIRERLSFSKASMVLTKPLKENKGSILIEFVACVPLLIILLLYIVDIIKIGRLNAQTEFVAYETANILQNIATDKKVEDENLPKIGKEEIIQAYCTSWLHLYPGTSLYYEQNSHTHLPMTIIWYIKGDEDGTASCIWGVLISTIKNNATDPEQITIEILDKQYPGSTVTWATASDPSIIYPNLQVYPGGEKILVETIVAYKSSDSVSPREALGLFGTLPRHKEVVYYHFVNSVISFSPKPQLFKEDSDLYFANPEAYTGS